MEMLELGPLGSSTTGIRLNPNARPTAATLHMSQRRTHAQVSCSGLRHDLHELDHNIAQHALREGSHLAVDDFAR